jgi:hypothetical protein
MLIPLGTSASKTRKGLVIEAVLGAEALPLASTIAY